MQSVSAGEPVHGRKVHALTIVPYPRLHLLYFPARHLVHNNACPIIPLATNSVKISSRQTVRPARLAPRTILPARLAPRLIPPVRLALRQEEAGKLGNLQVVPFRSTQVFLLRMRSPAAQATMNHACRLPRSAFLWTDNIPTPAILGSASHSATTVTSEST